MIEMYSFKIGRKIPTRKFTKKKSFYITTQKHTHIRLEISLSILTEY